MSERTEVKCKSGLTGWQGKLSGEYKNFDSFVAWDEMYGLAARLGFKSARDAWLADPMIQGSTIPDDYCLVWEPLRGHFPKHVKVVVELQIDTDAPAPEWAIRQAAEQAVRSAVEAGEQNGFVHQHADEMSIGLVDVETAGNELNIYGWEKQSKAEEIVAAAMKMADELRETGITRAEAAEQLRQMFESDAP